MRISFFFPAYNDEATVEPLARLLDRILSAECDEHEILIIDDAGPDRSGEVADRVAGELPDVRAIHHAHNLGYGRVLQTGLRNSRFEWIGFTDGDMQYDVNELPRLIELARDGADAIVGYKAERADGWRRRLTSGLYNASIRLLLGLDLRDADCAFKLMHRRVFEGFMPSVDYREAFLLVEAFYKARRAGARIEQVPVSHRKRLHGGSNCFTWRTARRMAWYTTRAAVYGRLLGGFH